MDERLAFNLLIARAVWAGAVQGYEGRSRAMLLCLVKVLFGRRRWQTSDGPLI